MNEQQHLLEICVFNIATAIAAQDAGADRLELCENYANGGTTPSYGTLRVIREKITIPVFPMIRPRGGDFDCSADEFKAMKKDVLLCKELGFEGVVIGILKPDGKIDIERNSILVELAYPLEVTFHRAFDRCAAPLQALEDIISCGCQRILTSGQKTTAIEGQQLIQQLVHQAGERIIIMPGSGVKSSNIAGLKAITGATEFHTSARKLFPGGMQFINHDIEEEHFIDGVNAEEIKALKQIIATFK
ncbi:MAG: copper homeostasis protein CutC [Bacteroidota bacterium]|nr:copper homeostasis protein CutC [Bacteroidota bacterium]